MHSFQDILPALIVGFFLAVPVVGFLVNQEHKKKEYEKSLEEARRWEQIEKEYERKHGYRIGEGPEEDDFRRK